MNGVCTRNFRAVSPQADLAQQILQVAQHYPLSLKLFKNFCREVVKSKAMWPNSIVGRLAIQFADVYPCAVEISVSRETSGLTSHELIYPPRLWFRLIPAMVRMLSTTTMTFAALKLRTRSSLQNE